MEKFKSAYKYCKEEEKHKFLDANGELKGVNVNSKSVIKILGKNSKHIVKCLVDNLIIIRKEFYRTDQLKSYWKKYYTFIPLFHVNTEPEEMHLNTFFSNSIINKVRYRKDKAFEKWVQNTKLFNHNYANLNERLLIDEYYSKDFFAERFYSPLTNIPSFLRQYLLLNGNKTVEIDIKSSQPTCLFSFLDNNDLWSSILGIDGINTNNAFSEICLLKKHLNKGLFYEFLGEQFDAESLISEQDFKECKTKRDQGKKVAMYLLFGDVHNKVTKAVQVVFPQFVQLLIELKSVKLFNGIEVKKNIAYILQKIEKDLLVRVIIACDFPVTTIHDSYICEESNKSKLEEIIQRVYNECSIVNMKYSIK